MNKILVIIGLVVGIGGIIFSLLPPDMHMALFGGSDQMDSEMGGMDNMDSGHHKHGAFVTYGLVVAVVGLGAAVAGWKIF